MGKYTDYFANENTWRKVRVSECKGSGVAAACVVWRQSCSGTLESIVRDSAPAKQDAACKAINQMSTALKTAKKKLHPCLAKHKITPVMSSPYNETRHLLDDWDKALDGYQRSLMETRVRFEAVLKQRKAFLDKLTLDGVLKDGKLWAHFVRYATDIEASREMVESYKLFKTGRISDMVRTYGDGNHYNIEGRFNQILLRHFVDKVPVTPVLLKPAIEALADGFFQVLDGDTQDKMLGRFVRHERGQKCAEERFPDA